MKTTNWTPNWSIAGVITIALFIVLGVFLPPIIRKENANYEQEKIELAMECLNQHGGYPILHVITDSTTTLEYVTQWEITIEELRALTYLAEHFNIMLHTQ